MLNIFNLLCKDGRSHAARRKYELEKVDGAGAVFQTS